MENQTVGREELGEIICSKKYERKEERKKSSPKLKILRREGGIGLEIVTKERISR